MLWRLVNKIARLYSFGAILILLFFLATSYLAGHQTNNLDLLFPYGVLAGLIVSRIHMSTGGLVTLFAVAGYYLSGTTATGENHIDHFWPLVLAGPAPLFLIAGMLKSISRSQQRRT